MAQTSRYSNLCQIKWLVLIVSQAEGSFQVGFDLILIIGALWVQESADGGSFVSQWQYSSGYWIKIDWRARIDGNGRVV